MIDEAEYDSRWCAEWKLIYSVIVAGKTAKMVEQIMPRLISGEDPGVYPFDQIREHLTRRDLRAWLLECRSGNYGKLTKCFPALVAVDPEACTVEELEAIHGIGPKTSRFFLLWTRPGVRYAALDTHLMKFLRRLGYTTLTATPVNMNVYRALETKFLELCTKMAVEPRQLDWWVWKAYVDGTEDGLFETLKTYGIKESPTWRIADRATRRSSGSRR